MFAPVRNDWVGESVTRKADENVTIKIEESLAREFLDAASLLHEEKVLPIGWQKPLELLYEDSLNEYPRVKSGDFSENTIAEIAILE